MGHSRNLRNLEKQKKDREVAAQRRADVSQSLKKNKTKTHRSKHKKKDEYKHTHPITHLVLDPELLDRIGAQSNLFVDAEENDVLEPVRAIEPYIELAALMTQAVSSPGIYLTLCWPVGFEWVGLAHALASRTLAANSHGQQGLRMALYPSIQSNYGRYRRTRFPMQGFLIEARNAANNINISLSPRHRAYMHLNQLEKDEDPRKHPALANAISLFEWDPTSSDWSLYGNGYFSDVRLALHHHAGKTKQHKEQIAEYATIMADPKQAHEAAFRIKRKTKPASARKLFISGDQAYDLIVIDARQNLLKGAASWRNALRVLIEQVAKSETTPSLVLLADDPATYQVFLLKLLELAKNKNKLVLTKRFYHYHWLRHTNYLWEQNETSDVSLTPWPNIDARVTDAQSLFDISKINKLARTINEGNPELARELRRTGGFLRRLVDMPVGQKAIEQWLQSATKDWSEIQATQLASRYTWRHYRLDMYRRIEGSPANDPVVLERCMKIADPLVNRIADSTSIERTAIELVYEFVADSKRTMILVEDHKYIALLEASLKSHIDDSIMDFVSIRTDAHQSHYSEFDALLVAGTGKSRVTNLLFANQLPNSIVLLLDAYSAWTIERDLVMLKGIDDFSPIHPRIEKLLSLIEPQIKSFKQAGSIFELPTDLPANQRHSANDYDLSDPYAMLHLSGFGVLPVGEFSSLIKENPDRHPPFHAMTINDVTEGDRLLVLGDEQRDKISDILKVQGGRLTNSAEKILIVYFEIARVTIREHYPQYHRTQRARALLDKMLGINLETAKEVGESMIVRWVKHIEEFELETSSVNSNEFKMNSPRHKAHFMLFAEALGIDPASSQLYWDKGIYQLRIGRILEGRKLGGEIKGILTGAIELADLHMEPGDSDALFAIANECTYPVEMIIFKDDLDEEKSEC